MLRSRRIVDDSSDEEFPDIKDLLNTNLKKPASSNCAITPQTQAKDSSTAKNATVRRRKLGDVSVNNPLTRPLGSDRSLSASTLFEKEDTESIPRKKKLSTTPQRVELRTRKTKPIISSVELAQSDFSETGSFQEETILEGFSQGDDDDASDFEASQEADSDDDSFTAEFFLPRSPSKSRRVGGRDSSKREDAHGQRKKRSPSPGAQLLAEAIEAQEREKKPLFLKDRNCVKKDGDACRKSRDNGSKLADPLSKLRVHDLPPPKKCGSPSEVMNRVGTPPSPPLEPKIKGLVSPSKKISRIPATPHRPHMDTFWDQEFIDEWNDEHSPKKQLFVPSATIAKTQGSSPDKKKASFSPQKGKKTSEAAAQKAAKKAFAQAKHEVADKFLKELDERITENKISELAESTGGIRIEWSNKLNTTAGRANWKRETMRTKTGSGAVATEEVRYRHHASIELAEKVIDDEHRLLNVIAHEFCHLANFMITGITNNPHGKEFKAWAYKVTQAFGESRGIEVTTKHSYEIDFKYVWECEACGIEYKRHSKSIHPDRHRCGSCKGVLKQTKPVPRKGATVPAGGMEAGKEGAVVVKKESEYQRFMKEQMKLIKTENPGILQKDVMRMVASRWAAQKAGGLSGAVLAAAKDVGPSTKVEGVAKAMNKLTIIDLT